MDHAHRHAQRRLEKAVAAFKGRDFEAVVRLCSTVLVDIGDAAGRECDRLRVRSAYVLIQSSELLWRSSGVPSSFSSFNSSVDIDKVTRSVEDAAARLDEPIMTAVARYLRGRCMVVTDNLPRAVASIAEAAAIAANSGCTFVEFEALTDLGHITVGRSLVRGLDILRQAQSLAPAVSKASALPEHHMMVPLVRDRLTGYLGLAHFDNGDFGKAEPLLRSSYESALTAGLPSTAQTMTNYFAQLLMTCGRFEEAEELLRSALAMADTSKASYHVGYNLALLGKLYLEWDRPEAAEKPMLAGWHQTTLAGNLSIIPLVRNYLGELYLCARYRGRDIRRAAALFHETVTECQRTGFQRSEIAALAFGAQTALQAQDIDRAMACSAAAVRRLDEVGTMPALRTEEIYLTRYQVLMAANHHAEARHWIDKARTTLEAKAVTIPDGDLRRIFRTRVQISRAILATA